MFKPVELFVGLRYLRAKRRNHFISVISLISMLGITLGVMALIVVLSVMNGFQTELRDRILSMTAHATITSFEGGITAWQNLRAQALEHAEVIGAAPYVEGQGMLSHQGEMSGILLRGVLPDEEPQVSDVGAKMVAGSLDSLISGDYNIILGRDLAYALGVGMGDKVILLVSQGAVTPAGFVPRLRRFTVSGIFAVGMYEYDRNLAVVHMEDAGRLLNLDGVSGVRLKLDDMFRAPLVAHDLTATLQGPYYVSDWTRYHSNFFQAIRTEKTVMFTILLLIVAVAAFNIISTLVMVVTDKQADIAILRTLGATPRGIMAVFMVQGLVIGVLGTVLGILGGVLLALNVETIVQGLEHLFNTQFLPADVYYISELPSELHLADIVTIGITSFLLTLLSTLYPAWRAARTQPAEALRYE